MGRRRSGNIVASDILAAAHAQGAAVVERPNGHFQIRGRLLVNYYPFSKRRSAYIAGTTGGRHDVSPTEAVTMAFVAPPTIRQDDMANRKKNSRAKRAAMLKRGFTKCVWCGCQLDLDNSTIEHIIPLKRGGLDNANNRTLACVPCNSSRGHDMPELRATEVRNEGRTK